jgi:hypothetical protein
MHSSKDDNGSLEWGNLATLFVCFCKLFKFLDGVKSNEYQILKFPNRTELKLLSRFEIPLCEYQIPQSTSPTPHQEASQTGFPKAFSLALPMYANFLLRFIKDPGRGRNFQKNYHASPHYKSLNAWFAKAQR